MLAPAVTFLSIFLKNVGALAIFLPFALQIARRSGTPPSKLLMPLSFGSLIGGLVTLVGTSPNLLVSRVREDILGEPFGMFDFAPVGLGIVATGLAFILVGWRLLPSERRGRASAKEAFRVEPYLSEVRLPPDSPMVGKTVSAFEAKGDGGVSVVASKWLRGQSFSAATFRVVVALQGALTGRLSREFAPRPTSFSAAR